MEQLGLQEEYGNADELINDLFRVAKKTNHFIYRGISRTEERYPNIMRIWHGGKYQPIHYTREIKMLKEFRRYAASLLDNTFSPIDFVSCAQHFGVPTRLLDWTSSPFVALFFSLSAPWDDAENFQYRLLCCDKSQQIVLDDLYSDTAWGDVLLPVNDTLIAPYERFINRTNNEKGLSSILPHLGEKPTPEKLQRFVVLEPNNSNPRITAQHGLFVIPKTRSKEKINAEYKAAGVKTIVIDKSIRDEALAILENIGYSSLQLFFDLQNIASYIKEKALQ